MLNDLDETIKQVLIRTGGGDFDPAQVDISFDLPNREWSAGVQRPTINCYLFDIRERLSLPDTIRHESLAFYDISYLITAWTRAVEDEHYLLWRVLTTLLRYPVLNKRNIYLDDDHMDNLLGISRAIDFTRLRLVDCLQGSLQMYAEQEDDLPIYTSIGQIKGILNQPGELWTALENQLKPSLTYTVTLGFDQVPFNALSSPSSYPQKNGIASGMVHRWASVPDAQQLFVWWSLTHEEQAQLYHSLPLYKRSSLLKILSLSEKETLVDSLDTENLLIKHSQNSD